MVVVPADDVAFVCPFFALNRIVKYQNPSSFSILRAVAFTSYHRSFDAYSRYDKNRVTLS